MHIESLKKDHIHLPPLKGRELINVLVYQNRQRIPILKLLVISSLYKNIYP